MIDERFDSQELDRSVWVPWYLPHWSSRAASAATYEVGGGELRLSIPVDQPLWAEGVHETPLRVSGIQSANYSGPVGSTIGGQPFLPEQRVLEEQGEFWGYTPVQGDIEIRMRGTITPRSMIAFWLSGIETAPELSGEICVMEVFGSAPQAVGMGLHRFRDPRLTEDWEAVTLPIDVSEFHTYGVNWRPGSLAFSVDGEVVKRVGQAPDYPVQLEIAVFDFPDKAHLVDGPVPVPELVVSHVRGS
ncbi:glycoside hydrolase family 16 protein [Paractinoplanes lichenicola]|uniref:Glycoside hydrolase family 16 protein n=1 Tax=Paractinoplanes lichenicola TaxID=2802976 RepID=A0ABS1W425_9ACTN|nr:glycoside hydrolase family 16 protein [Actinoplanes lichenicola]MBL7261474.1 glycoside hydrolase family 16 protein [Actinoplanes lichenicola]